MDQASHMLKSTLDSGRLAPAKARVFAGLLLRLASCSSHFCGRGQLNFLHAHAYGQSAFICPELRLQLELQVQLTHVGLRRTICLDSRLRPRAVVHTDAACAPDALGDWPEVTISNVVCADGTGPVDAPG